MQRFAPVFRRLLVATPVAAAVAAPSVAFAQPWVIDPAANAAAQINNLFWLTFVLAVVVFVLVEGLLIYSSLRFRRRAPLPVNEPPQIHGNTRLEVMWAIVPALILIGLFGASVRTLNALATFPDDALRVEVIARQFAFQFRYPDAGVEVTNDLRLPVGVPVIFEVTSPDVVHSFWVPSLHGKIDALPGRINRLWLRPEEVGVYRGVCAELCGAGHAQMLFRAETMQQDAFQQWLVQQQTGATAATVAGPDVAAAHALFAAKGCGGCHTLAGVPGAVGQIGPNLTNIGAEAATRRPGMTAEAYIRESLVQPNAFAVPGFPPAMPQVPLTDEELNTLVNFLLTQR